MSKRPHLLLSTTVVVLLGLSTAASAQTGHSTSAPGSAPTNAELQKEIESLRAEIRQLQQAQRENSTGANASAPTQDGTAADTMGKHGMGMGKDCMEMDKGCAAGKDGMGMGKDKSMKPMEPMHQDMDDSMPAPSAPADSMGHM
ncbi:MAG: hypothetical protein AB7O49_04325 [Sphingomonadales bacterium]